MATLTERWLRPQRPRTQFPPYELGDASIVGMAQARTDTVARIYHKGHEQAWDGRTVLDELEAKHGGIHFPEDKKAAFAQVAAVLLWGELAAWSISADLAVKLEDTPAKMAASSQVFDEARHFYVLRDYLWRAGIKVEKLGGWSRRLLVELLETENLLYKVVGMQLLVESTAVVMFRAIAEAKLEPVLTELLYYFERDEARHVGLGVLTLPAVLEGLSDRDALALWWFQTRMQFEMIASGMTINPAFAALGVDPAEMNLQGFHYHNEIIRRMKRTRPEQGVDAKAVKGLFRISRAGQDRFQELFFPTKPQPPWKRALLGGFVNVARTTDRWLARRGPQTAF
ncbi:MAG: ferritin-like domain-containing protein [Deltaproteobacteria bacterium]|nr:ferritin-like domain-containing protein [Deltaproteobacteria bacterium]MDQ3300201.1 ferritin-like domain-containing protein [Myxococcota bacterium]